MGLVLLEPKSFPFCLPCLTPRGFTVPERQTVTVVQRALQDFFTVLLIRGLTVVTYEKVYRTIQSGLLYYLLSVPHLSSQTIENAT